MLKANKLLNSMVVAAIETLEDSKPKEPNFGSSRFGFLSVCCSHASCEQHYLN